MKHTGYALAIFLGVILIVASVKFIFYPDPLSEKLLFSPAVTYIFTLLAQIISPSGTIDPTLDLNKIANYQIALLVILGGGFSLVILSIGALKKAGYSKEATFFFLLILAFGWIFSKNVVLAAVSCVSAGLIFLGDRED